MKLTGRFALIPLPNGKEWVVYNELTYAIDIPEHPNGWTVVVEAGFITDLTSRPWAMALLVDRWGKHGPAAVLHDWLYWFQPCSRAAADEAMRSVMVACGVPAWRARSIWLALKAGGWWAWRGNAKRREAGEDAIYRGDLDRIGYLAEASPR